LITINCESGSSIISDKNDDKKTMYVFNNSSFDKLDIIPDILVVDEAHTHQQSLLNAGFMEKIARRYFFTATPQNMTDETFYGETIYRFDYDLALEMNYVTQFKIVPIWASDETEKATELKTKNGRSRIDSLYSFLRDSQK
jgi:superfamily II DNA or RNA helicase